MKREAGFSLIEALVAMTLLALIGVMAAGGVRFGSTVWDRVEKDAAHFVEIRAVQRFLRRQIAAAEAIRISNGTRTPSVVFNGTEDDLRLLAPLAARSAPPGLHFVHLGVSDSKLTLRWARVTDFLPEIGPDAARTDLLPGLTGIRISYFGQDPESGALVWQRSWLNRPALPRLVRVEPIWDAPASRQWPHLVIALDQAGQT